MDIEEKAVERNPAPTLHGLPLEDYDEKGNLKPIRARIVKKLLKYEFRAIFPRTFILLGVLAGLTVLMNMFYLVSNNDQMKLLELPKIFTTLFYVFAVVATPIGTVWIAAERYRRNFFKSEGYLTFSIPASMEEHVFAKHLSGIVVTFIAIVSSAISVLITLFLLWEGGVDGEVAGSLTISPLSIAFEILEFLLLFLETLIGVFCVCGALACWEQKFEKKTRIILWVVIVYLIFTTLETLFWFMVDEGVLSFLFTETGGHIGRCAMILLGAAVIVFSVWYELKKLKNKLNLK